MLIKNQSNENGMCFVKTVKPTSPRSAGGAFGVRSMTSPLGIGVRLGARDALKLLSAGAVPASHCKEMRQSRRTGK